jgi:hypothetical protein
MSLGGSQNLADQRDRFRPEAVRYFIESKDRPTVLVVPGSLVLWALISISLLCAGLGLFLVWHPIDRTVEGILTSTPRSGASSSETTLFLPSAASISLRPTQRLIVSYFGVQYLLVINATPEVISAAQSNGSVVYPCGAPSSCISMPVTVVNGIHNSIGAEGIKSVTVHLTGTRLIDLLDLHASRQQ